MTSLSHPTEVIACCAFQGLLDPKARLPYKLGLSYFVARSPGLTLSLSFQSGRAILAVSKASSGHRCQVPACFKPARSYISNPSLTARPPVFTPAAPK